LRTAVHYGEDADSGQQYSAKLAWLQRDTTELDIEDVGKEGVGVPDGSDITQPVLTSALGCMNLTEHTYGARGTAANQRMPGNVTPISINDIRYANRKVGNSCMFDVLTPSCVFSAMRRPSRRDCRVYFDVTIKNKR
jgi:hypothetical protein